MSRIRKLAAIMFTDIKGYTALMQDNEEKAIAYRDRHRRIFKTITAKFNGKILQYYGDGTLSTFDSAIDAVKCAIEMQQGFRSDQVIPVRIGIHMGDIISTDEEIIGDAVNIASRIESMAIAGSVFISGKVKDELDNHPSVKPVLMGIFNMKNVDRPVELFAIANEGLLVPSPADLEGKGQLIAQMPDSLPGKAIHFLKLSWKRNVPQLVAGYFGAAWVLVEFIDWVLNRYQISPHWTDVFIVLTLAMLPSIFLYGWNRDRIVGGDITKTEKVFFPSNFLFSILLIAFSFKGTELGAKTSRITLTNEDGSLTEMNIVKQPFRKKVLAFRFSPARRDSSESWLSTGIQYALVEDLVQNGYMDVLYELSDMPSLGEKIELAKNDFFDYILTGSYEYSDGQYNITTKLIDVKTAAPESVLKFEGKDFFHLMDSISVTLMKSLGVRKEQRDQFVDLPVNEIFTSSLKAFSQYARWRQGFQYLEEATEIDSSFAIAYYMIANRCQFLMPGSIGAKEAINKGMQYRKRLPETWDIRMRTLYFQINGQTESAIALLKMQLEMDPANVRLVETLKDYLYMTGQYDELLAWHKTETDNDPNPDNQIGLVEALLLNEKFEEAGHLLRSIQKENPSYQEAIGTLALYYSLVRQIDKADSLLQQVILIEPEISVLVDDYKECFSYLKHNPGLEPKDLDQYEGMYRSQFSPSEFDVFIIGSDIYIKGRRQFRGYFGLPVSRHEFLITNGRFVERWKFGVDSSGRAYKINTLHKNRSGYTGTHVFWRQDSLISRAHLQLAFDQKAEALANYKAAYKKYPHHFFLDGYISHLEYLLDAANKDALKSMARFTGEYGPRNIWMEDGHLFYRRDGSLSALKMLPVAENHFIFHEHHSFQLKIIRRNGKLGLQGLYYDEETGQYEPAENDFHPAD